MPDQMVLVEQAIELAPVEFRHACGGRDAATGNPHTLLQIEPFGIAYRFTSYLPQRLHGPHVHVETAPFTVQVCEYVSGSGLKTTVLASCDFGPSPAGP